MEKSIQNILVEEFNRRFEKNALYSLRAYARDIGVLPSHLSSILKNKAGLSRARAALVANALNFSADQKILFIELAGSQFSRNQTQRNKALHKLHLLERLSKKSKSLDLDLFTSVSEWQHLAIVEMTFLKDFKSDPQWIAEYLGLEVSVVEDSIIRLLKFKLIVIKNGKLLATENYSLVDGRRPLAAVRKFHKQVLDKAQLAIENQTIEERSLRSTIVAIRKDKLKEAFLVIEKFHQDFCEEIGEGSIHNFEKDCLYALSTQFFKLSSIKKERNN